MLCRIHLHGYFKAFHDGPIEVHARTPAEAIAWVTRALPGFKPNAVHGRHRIRVVGCDQIEDLQRMLVNGEDLHLLPQFSGGKKGGFIQVLVGIAMVAVGFFTGQAWLMKIGAMAILGGLTSLLSPTPQSDSGEEKVKSRYLGAPKNTVEIGTRIPILYGEHQVYGHYLSFDIDAQRVAS